MKRRQALLATTSAGVVMLGGLGTAALPAAAATTGCSVTYRVQSQWSGGFVADVSVANVGSALADWTLTFDLPATGQTVTQGWNATWQQSDSRVTAASKSWN